MSKYGMLGLLEGVGRGITGTGQSMEKLNLQQAEERRQMNLAKIQRDWSNQDENTRYTRNLEDQERLAKEGREYQEGQDIVKRGQTLADQEREHTNRLAEVDHQAKVAAKNRQPSDFQEKMKAIDSDDSLSPAEKKMAKYGIGKGGDFTAKDYADLRKEATKQAALEVLGKEPLQSATPAQLKQIDSRSNDLVAKWAPGENMGAAQTAAPQIHQKEISAQAQIMVKAGYDPVKDKAGQLEKMKAAGIPDPVANAVIAEADALAASRKETPAKAPEQRATAGPPSNQPQLSQSNPIVEMLDRGRAMTPEQRKAAEEARKEKMRGSFVRPAPSTGLME